MRPGPKYLLNVNLIYSLITCYTLQVTSVTRICSTLIFATHSFYQIHVEAPIITITDPARFSEKFQVTTLFGRTIEEPIAVIGTQGFSHEAAKAAIKEKTNLVVKLK
ncbi:hypothetical protein SLE2022_210630 [Rubroshorea leprosula]